MNLKIKIPHISIDRDPYSYEPKPAQTWAIMLACFFVILIVLGLVSFKIYSSLEKAALNEQERIIPASQTVNREELKKTVDMYTGRKAEFENLISHPQNIQDPSI